MYIQFFILLHRICLICTALSLMDISSSSCIPGINVCKISFDSIPDKFRHLLATSLYTSKFPVMWTCAYVTLLPKTSDPGNWRPISQTNIFANILEEIVHKQFLEYLQTNAILFEFQYGFLPEKSTHESITL